MTNFLTLEQVLEIHREAIERYGGAAGIRDQGGLESAVAQPQMTFAGQELYPTLVDKAAALAFSLILNHPFVDGNKRVGYYAMDVFLRANGYKVAAPVDDAEAVTLGVAAGTVKRKEFTEWVREHITPLS